MVTPCRLRLLKGADNSVKTIHITELGAQAVGGGARIYELTTAGINCQAGKKELPFIYLRRRAHSDISAHQVYLSAGSFGLWRNVFLCRNRWRTDLFMK